jgi:hypothetical protein
MKQISLLRSIIKETIEEMELDEMARISVGYKLTDDYESAFAALPANIQNSTRYQRIVNYLKDNPGAPKPEISLGGGFGGDQQAINQLVNKLEADGVVEKTGLTKEKAPKSEPTGAGRGRPSSVNYDLRSMGAKVAQKYAAGNTDFNEEEVEYIMGLYDIVKSL